MKATLITDSVPFNTSTVARVAAGIAKMLSLPASTVDENFGNGFLYVSSFLLTQPEIFLAVLRATGTGEGEWQIERKSVGEYAVPEGDLNLVLVETYREAGGDYTGKLCNEMLGLEQEDLDEVVKSAIKESVGA